MWHSTRRHSAYLFFPLGSFLKFFSRAALAFAGLHPRFPESRTLKKADNCENLKKY